MEKQTENKQDLFVRVKATRSPEQNTESEGSDQVDMIAVEVNQKETESEKIIELNIHIQARNTKN
jgi:hypothetical protein